MSQPYYLRVARASDLENPKERRIYRFFEMLPGLLSWGTLLGVILFSWLAPVWAAIFVITFVIYWLLRTIYFSFHLWSGYRKMRINEKTDWIKKLQELPPSEYTFPCKDWKDLYHLIVIPTFKEPLDLLRATLGSLGKAEYPKERMLVVLAIEEREGEEAVKKAEILRQEFKDKFFRFLVTKHPDNLEGEIAGKGANEAWATKAVQQQLIDPLNIPYSSIIISSFDADTVAPSQYFACLTHYFLTTSNPTQTSFQPIPLFLNNIWQAPPLSRVFSFSATFWHTMNQERPEKLITFSSHSMSFKALVDVGHRQPNVVSDDSRIFWQCFLHYDGKYKVEPIYYPLSMDANAAPTLWQTLVNMYKQQRRWAYGVGEIPYFLFGFMKNKKIPFSKKLVFTAELLEGHWSWATSSILIFILGWMPLVIGGEAFSQSLLSYNLPRLTSRILTIAMVGLLSYIIVSLNLLPPRKPEYGKRGIVLFIAQWFALPFMMIFFTALPALEAQTRWMLGKYMGFWTTPKFRNNHSK